MIASTEYMATEPVSRPETWARAAATTAEQQVVPSRGQKVAINGLNSELPRNLTRSVVLNP